MMDVAAVKAPWSFGWETDARDWAIVTDAEGRIVANVNTETGPSVHSAPAMRPMPADANARLIAAAPELLWFAQQIFNGVDTGMIIMGTPADETLAYILQKGRAAISKATSRQPEGER